MFRICQQGGSGGVLCLGGKGGGRCKSGFIQHVQRQQGADAVKKTVVALPFDDADESPAQLLERCREEVGPGGMTFIEEK